MNTAFSVIKLLCHVNTQGLKNLFTVKLMTQKIKELFLQSAIIPYLSPFQGKKLHEGIRAEYNRLIPTSPFWIYN